LEGERVEKIVHLHDYARRIAHVHEEKGWG